MSCDPVTDVSALSPDASAKLLASIIEECSDKFLLFDLDSTLINNRPRNACIMREFAHHSGNQQLAHATAEHFPDWSARNSMQMLGVPDVFIDSLLCSYQEYWEARFFTGDYCKHDVAIDGAVAFVNAIVAAGGITRYLTGRNETMRAGTEASLQSLGFPEPGQARAKLIMKPEAGDSDDEFKSNTLRRLSGATTILAGFDNEPTHINTYRKAFPDALSVHLDTDHSMRQVKLLDGVISIRDFCY